MAQGLMVRVKNGTGLASFFHPTLPFSYVVGNFDLPGDWGVGVNNIVVDFEAPFPLIRPWFTLAGSTYNLGSYYVEKIAGTDKTYRITAERYIMTIDPQSGRYYWQNPDLPLLGDPSITIGDIRG